MAHARAAATPPRPRPAQVGGYALALFGLNMYQLLKARPKDAPLALPALAREAATNKQAIVMAAGALVLAFFARA